MEFGPFVHAYGYPLLFLLTLAEGETAVAIAGFAAYEGYVHFPTVILIAIAGAMIGDQALFLFGKYKGKEFLAKRPHLEAKALKIQQFLEKRQNWFIFGSRYMYGFRVILPITMGTSNITYRRFALINFFGAIAWSVIFASVGYLFGGAFEAILGNIKKIEIGIVVFILVVFSVVQLILIRRRRLNGNGNGESHPS